MEPTIVDWLTTFGSRSACTGSSCRGGAAPAATIVTARR